MQIDEYLYRYRKYRCTYERLQRMRESMINCGEKFTFDTESNSVRELLRFEQDLAHRERILRYATARLKAAMSRMESLAEVNYLMCRYFYNMKNSAIADVFSYCERHIYRLSASAKNNLYIELVKLMPKARRGKLGKTYRFASQCHRIGA